MTHPDGFETLAIHAGQEPDPLTGAVVPPIYQVSTYKQDGVGGLRSGYEYSRSANPTRTALETCLAALEGGARGLAFASGLAAEDTLLRTVCGPGDHVLIPDDAYGGTYRLFARVAERWGLRWSAAPLHDLDALLADGVAEHAHEVREALSVYGEHGHARLHLHRRVAPRLAVRLDDLVKPHLHELVPVQTLRRLNRVRPMLSFHKRLPELG